MARRGFSRDARAHSSPLARPRRRARFAASGLLGHLSALHDAFFDIAMAFQRDEGADAASAPSSSRLYGDFDDCLPRIRQSSRHEITIYFSSASGFL